MVGINGIVAFCWIFGEVMIIKKANSDYNDKQLSFFEN